jgi:Uma2 family endonuclease
MASAVPIPLGDTPAPRSVLGPYRLRDYERLPDEPRCELIFGRYVVSPAPLVRHQIVVALLWQHLERFARDSQGLAVLAPVDVVLADHSAVQPDVLYVSRERRGIVKDRVEGAPDLVVEVLSPGSAWRDRGDKLKLYAEGRVREYWIVDPAEKQIEFLVNDDGRFVVALGVDATYRSPAIEGLALDLAVFWAEVDARQP